MPILNKIDYKSRVGKLMIGMIYLLLILGGATMIYPFMITINGSFCTHFDYQRRSPLPRFLWKHEDRLLRTMTNYFPPSLRNSFDELRGYFPDFPEDWRRWSQVGDEIEESDSWAKRQLRELENPDRRKAFKIMATDLADFMENWDLDETVLAYDPRDVAPFLRKLYKDDIGTFNSAWQISVQSFNELIADEWRTLPLDQHTFLPERDVRYQDLLKFRNAYLDNEFTKFLRSKPDAIGLLRPAALAYIWEDYAGKELKIKDTAELAELPFPVGKGSAPGITAVWENFLKERFPLRHIEITPTVQLRQRHVEFLQERFVRIENLNRLMRDSQDNWQDFDSWQDVPLPATVPSDTILGKIWMDFIQQNVPVESWQIRPTLPEKAFQKFAVNRHGSLEKINQVYGANFKNIEQLRIPFRGAFLDTFANAQWQFTLHQTLGNYYTAFDNLVLRGNALPNTVILVVLTLLATLTVNPLAAYAMSRFRLRHTNTILLYFIGTMAFPASVSAIPGFLLLRDLGLLNTFAALVLPTAANGMSIFLLKGFFDSLPQELYEAATIDGATEMQIFRVISLPLVKPILAVSALNAFIQAYNGWAWAIIVAQDREMWTLAVWTYQFSQIFASEPFVVMAAFLLNSLPVFVVFLCCQKIIMRGIILPQMK